MQSARHLLIKPASGGCNLRCTYCFYRDETEKRPCASYGVRTEQTQEAVIPKGRAAGTRGGGAGAARPGGGGGGGGWSGVDGCRRFRRRDGQTWD